MHASTHHLPLVHLFTAVSGRHTKRQTQGSAERAERTLSSFCFCSLHSVGNPVHLAHHTLHTSFAFLCCSLCSLSFFLSFVLLALLLPLILSASFIAHITFTPSFIHPSIHSSSSLPFPAPPYKYHSHLLTQAQHRISARSPSPIRSRPAPMPSSPCGCCIRKHSQHPALAPSARARARVHQRRSPSFLLPSLLYPRSEHSPRLKTLLALLLSLSPGLVLSQNPALYTPRYGAGSAVLNNTLYLVGGITGVISPSATRDVLAVSLEAPFTADAIPWIRRTTTGVPISDAYVAASKDQSRLVLVGFNSSYPLAIVYDFLLDQWVLPPTPTPPLTSRVAVGIVTDTDTGLFAMYGGLTPSPDSKLSSELDILYPNSSSINQWTWSPPTTEAMMPALFQPMMFYLSGSQSVLILGGCDGYLPTSGLSSCAPLSKGYLISTALQETPIASRIPSIMALKSKEGVIPTSRLSPCNTLLPNGNILVHGGVTFGNTESLSDTWVLDTKTWTWTQISLKNAPTQGRAGATCQVVAPNLVVVVGGKWLLSTRCHQLHECCCVLDSYREGQLFIV